MEIKTIKCKSGNIYNIVNETWKNKGAWGHKSTLLTNNNLQLGQKKIKYINRTWESYIYQSCMKCLINDILTENFESFLTEYKDINNIERLKKGQKEEIKKIWENKKYTKDLMEIKEQIL